MLKTVAVTAAIASVVATGIVASGASADRRSGARDRADQLLSDPDERGRRPNRETSGIALPARPPATTGTTGGSTAAAAARHGERPGAVDATGRLAEVAREPTSLPTVSLRPEIEVLGATREEGAALAEAVESFRSAGLQLPDLVVVFHDDPAPCAGHEGLFQWQHVPWRIRICSRLAFVPTHELAHAWERANLDDAARERYLPLRGLETWSSSDAAWGDRGVEDAAFVIQQNLMASRADVDSERWQEMAAAYEALTGSISPVLTPTDATDAS